MAERLVVLSDMWGVKKGLWVTSYMGYLQQYYDITYYDCAQLGGVSVSGCKDATHKAMLDCGLENAVSALLELETEPSHYLAFSMGGAVAWKAALKGLPVKSLCTVSATRVRMEENAPQCDLKLFFGAEDAHKPSPQWLQQMNAEVETMPDLDHDMYTHDQVARHICLDLLKRAKVVKQLAS